MIRWHYPRTALAERLLDTFEVGITNALTLYAPLRMGKTEFVLCDLIPAAEALDYRVLYVSFWWFTESPVQCLRFGLERARGRKRWKPWLMPSDSVVASSLTLQGATPGIKPSRQRVTQAELVALAEEFEALLRGRKKLLLCFDEVQHLATSPSFESLVYFLRTLIDSHRERVKVVYTGSCLDGLHRLFDDGQAPLFKSSARIDLPDPGVAFVEYIVNAFTQATSRKIGMPAALEAFRLLGEVPYDFRVVVERLMRYGGTDIVAQAEEYLDETGAASDYSSLWASLPPIDRAVLLHLAKFGGGLYREASRASIGRCMGRSEPVAAHVVQGAMNRLRRNLITPVERGAWAFEDREFRQWLVDLDG